MVRMQAYYVHSIILTILTTLIACQHGHWHFEIYRVGVIDSILFYFSGIVFIKKILYVMSTYV